jgi:hypothetical protein
MGMIYNPIEFKGIKSLQDPAHNNCTKRIDHILCFLLYFAVIETKDISLINLILRHISTERI